MTECWFTVLYPTSFLISFSFSTKSQFYRVLFQPFSPVSTEPCGVVAPHVLREGSWGRPGRCQGPPASGQVGRTAGEGMDSGPGPRTEALRSLGRGRRQKGACEDTKHPGRAAGGAGQNQSSEYNQRSIKKKLIKPHPQLLSPKVSTPSSSLSVLHFSDSANMQHRATARNPGLILLQWGHPSLFECILLWLAGRPV